MHYIFLIKYRAIAPGPRCYFTLYATLSKKKKKVREEKKVARSNDTDRMLTIREK